MMGQEMGHNNRESENEENSYKEEKSWAKGIISTIAPLGNIVGGGMSKSWDKILDGTYDMPKTLLHLVQKYLRNMKQDNNVPQEHNPTITPSEIKRRL